MTIADDGRKALEAQSFDVVLMDVPMPVMDGYEATGRDPLAREVQRRLPTRDCHDGAIVERRPGAAPRRRHGETLAIGRPRLVIGATMTGQRPYPPVLMYTTFFGELKIGNWG